MSHTLSQIAKATGLELVGDGTVTVSAAAEPESAGPDDLALAMSEKFADALARSAAHAAVVWEGADIERLGLKAALLARRPRVALAHVTRHFSPDPDLPESIHPAAIVDPSAEIGAGARIGPLVVVGARAHIGPGARIAAHVTIGAEARIGANALIHSGVRIGARCVIGDDFVAQPNAVIGSDGFSFEPPERGNVEAARSGALPGEGATTTGFLRIHSLAAVEIGDDVEIGAGSTIDRGTIVPTRIGSGSKLDNQVQVGHNVQIGRMCLVCGQVGIAGSARIGDRVVLGGKTGVADHVSIGDDTVCAAATMVASNVGPRQVMMGTPAMARKDAVEQIMAVRRLPRLLKQMSELRAKLGL